MTNPFYDFSSVYMCFYNSLHTLLMKSQLTALPSRRILLGVLKFCSHWDADDVKFAQRSLAVLLQKPLAQVVLMPSPKVWIIFYIAPLRHKSIRIDIAEFADIAPLRTTNE